MRVVIAGKGWLATRSARLVAAMLAAGHGNGAVEVVRNGDDDGTDTWLPSLVALARRRGWAVHDDVSRARLHRGDLFLSLQHDRILRCADLGGAPAYNLHFGRLPAYRGSLTAVLPIRHGQTRAGVTLHVLAERVDAGPVVAARTFGIPPFYTAYDLYRACHAHGFELLKDHAGALLDGSADSWPQDESAAATFRRSAVNFSDVELRDFRRAAEEVRDYCRSLIFPPRQYPTYRGRQIGSCYSICWNAGDNPPGTVVHHDPDQVIVACLRGSVCLEWR